MIKQQLVGALIATLLGQSALADSPTTLAQDTVQSFEKLFGVIEGKRRNHTKGFCFKGTLTPVDTSITQYSTSELFTSPSTVVGRLSHKGGNNNAPDHKPAEYGMGLALTLPSGNKQFMAMNTLDFFPVSTPEAFAQLMRAKAEGPDAVKAFKEKSSELQRFKAHEASKTAVLTPYEGSTYNSINSFYLTNGAGVKTAIRWSFVPTKEQKIVKQPQQDFFFENMQDNLESAEISWNMIVTLANATDLVDNAAIPWTGEHTSIIAATLSVTSVSTEEKGQCNNINFDPLVVADGFEPSDDPLLLARRLSYAISFGKRYSEQQKNKE